jgi:hypothetical protein
MDQIRSQRLLRYKEAKRTTTYALVGPDLTSITRPYRLCKAQGRPTLARLRSLQSYDRMVPLFSLSCQRGQIVLPYLESQKVLDGSELFRLTDDTDDVSSSSRAPSSSIGHWRVRQRDVPPVPIKLEDVVFEGSRRADGVHLPPAMRSAERLYGHRCARSS